MFLVLLLAAAAPQAATLKPACKTAPTLIKEGQRGRVRPLTSEPKADLYYTVVRTENGCQKSVLVSEERRGR